MRRLTLDALTTLLSVAGELADNMWRDKQRRTLGIDALWREVGAMSKRIDELEGRRGWTPLRRD